MSGICSAHNTDEPVEGCVACHSSCADLFGAEAWAAAVAEAEAAGQATCVYCDFTYYKTVEICPSCNGKGKGPNKWLQLHQMQQS